MTRRLLAALLVPLLLADASAQSLKDTLPHVSVVGEASEDALPDQAIVRLRIVTEETTASEAAAENERKTRTIVDELLRRGAAKETIESETETLASIATEETARGPHAKRAPRGFRVTSKVRVGPISLDLARSLLAYFIDADAKEISGADFVVGDEAARLQRLRIAALEIAQQRAKSSVEALGAKLGRLIAIDQDDVRPSSETNCEPKAAEPAADAIRLTLRPAARRLTAKVSATWAISR